MPTRTLSREAAQDALNLYELHNRSATLAGHACGLSESTFRGRLNAARKYHLEPEAIKAMPTLDGKGLRVLAIPDLHAPFQHPDAIAFLRACRDQFTPQRVVCLGDELDQHAISQHDPDPDGYSAGHELNVGLEFMHELYNLFPICAVIESNHGVRPFKRAYRAGLPKAYLKDYHDFMQAPKGWYWQHTVEIDGVGYVHGEGYLGKDAAMNCAKDNMKPMVIGHVHGFAGVQYFNNGEKQIWGMNAGCLIDVASYAMRYAKHHRSKAVIGVGLVDKGIPLYFPMRMDSKNRWTGQI